MNKFVSIFWYFFLILCFDNCIREVFTFGLAGKFDFQLDKMNNYYAIANRGYYNQTRVLVKINCKTGEKMKIGWLLRLSECADEFYLNSEQIPIDVFKRIFQNPVIGYHISKQIKYMKQNLSEFECKPTIDLDDLIPPKLEYGNSTSSFRKDTSSISNEESDDKRRKRDGSTIISEENASSLNQTTQTQPNAFRKANNTENVQEVFKHNHFDDEHIVRTWQDGSYLFILYTEPVNNEPYTLDVTVSFIYKNGYLSANDWPFLPFFSVMCAIYSVYAIYWGASCLCYWRDLLRVQIWIGAVILLGLMEKAAYLAEYDGINRHGYSIKVAIVVAELISCVKRSLARMLVIIVSLGFGIVKPRLGATMQKVVSLGVLYLIFAILDAIFRVMERKEDTDSKGVLAGVPLVFIDVSICYWILSNLQQTMRTLRLRRNIPKLTLYRHFTNTLIFCVIASVIFMIWSLARHKFVECLKDWKELWLDEGFWHILFSFILLIIIILWRPSNNSQRFAFSPLLDNDDLLDDDDDENEEQETEIFNSVKMRTKSNSDNNKATVMSLIKTNQKSIEEELKWVEDNVPSTITETAIPGLVDSEEEIMTTRLEMSKMD